MCVGMMLSVAKSELSEYPNDNFSVETVKSDSGFISIFLISNNNSDSVCFGISLKKYTKLDLCRHYALSRLKR